MEIEPSKQQGNGEIKFDEILIISPQFFRRLLFPTCLVISQVFTLLIEATITFARDDFRPGFTSDYDLQLRGVDLSLLCYFYCLAALFLLTIIISVVKIVNATTVYARIRWFAYFLCCVLIVLGIFLGNIPRVKIINATPSNASFLVIVSPSDSSPVRK